MNQGQLTIVQLRTMPMFQFWTNQGDPPGRDSAKIVSSVMKALQWQRWTTMSAPSIAGDHVIVSPMLLLRQEKEAGSTWDHCTEPNLWSHHGPLLPSPHPLQGQDCLE